MSAGLRRRAALLLGAFCLAGVPHAARAVDFGAGPVLVFADEIDVDQANQTVVARGGVEVTRGGRRLLADALRYDLASDEVRAEGNVVLLEPAGEAVFADSVVLSGDLRNGVLDQLRGRLPDDSRFAASTARRIDGNRTEMDRAAYSPCPICAEDGEDGTPLWQLSARRLVHDQAEQEISYNHAFFELGGVPVAYTPYFAHPDPTVKRKSGFLSPTVGSDSDLGFTLETPYYFALDPSYDLTLAPIFTTNEGPVLAADWRQMLRAGRYNLGGSVTYTTEAEDASGQPTDDNEVRGHIQGEGRFRLSNRWTGGYDLFVASDDTYLQRYDFSNRSILDNRAFAERIWGANYVGVNGYGFQGLRESDDQGLIPIVLPLAEAELVQPWRFGTRFTLDTSVLALTRTDGLDTRRFSTTGGFEVPWLGLIGDRYRLRLSARGDVYQTEGNPQTLAADGSSDLESRFFPRATLEWSWPLIGDTFGLTPILEPVVVGTVAPSDVNDDDIPNEDSLDLEFDDTNLFEPSRFPGLDVVEDGAHVAYGLRLGLFGNDGEAFNALFGQSYRFFGDDDVFDADSGLQDDLSDFVGRLELTPHNWLNIRYRFRLDRDSLSLLRNEVRAVVGPSQLRADVTYLSLDDDPAADEFPEREEITAGLLLGLTPRLAVRGQSRRDLERSEFIAHNVGLIYRHPCLLLIAGFERRFTRNRDARPGTNVTLRLVFQNLGEVGARTALFGL